jgi:hypothetical protein
MLDLKSNIEVTLDHLVTRYLVPRYVYLLGRQGTSVPQEVIDEFAKAAGSTESTAKIQAEILSAYILKHGTKKKESGEALEILRRKFDSNEPPLEGDPGESNYPREPDIPAGVYFICAECIREKERQRGVLLDKESIGAALLSRMSEDGMSIQDSAELRVRVEAFYRFLEDALSGWIDDQYRMFAEEAGRK